MLTSKVKGLDRLLKQIASLSDLQIDAAAQAVGQGAKEIAAAIARAAPKHTGDMADHIKAETVKEDQKGNEHVAGGLGLAWKVTAPFPAKFVEFGTKASDADAPRRNRRYKSIVVFTKGTRAHHATRAEPFFWPTIKAYQKRVRSRLSKASNKAARAAAAIK